MQSVRWVFEHGKNYSAPGEGRRVRLTIFHGGRTILEDVDRNDEASLRGERQLGPEELSYLDEVLASAHLVTLGKSVGTGPAWGKLAFEHEGDQHEMCILHRSTEGVLDPDAIVGLAKAALPILGILLHHMSVLAPSLSSDGPEEITELRAKPIVTDGPWGRLLMRFTIANAVRPERIWVKLYEGGDVERRCLATSETDGESLNEPPTQIGSGRTAELFELVKRHVPRTTDPSEPCAIWELYSANGKRDIRSVSLGDDDRPSRTGAPARVSAVHEAFAAFASLLDRQA